MTTDTHTHDVVVTQRFAEKEFRDAAEALIHIVVTTTQVAEKKGIERQLHLEISQPQKIQGRSDLIRVRKNLSPDDAEHLREAADRLAGVAEGWRPLPIPDRNSTEFTTTVADGFVIGKRTTDDSAEYFVVATDEHLTARCVLGDLNALSNFIRHVKHAANHLR